MTHRCQMRLEDHVTMCGNSAMHKVDFYAHDGSGKLLHSLWVCHGCIEQAQIWWNSYKAIYEF